MIAKRTLWKFAVVWIASLVVVAAVASTLTWAQANDRRVISGNDLGFRVDSERGGIPTGRLVVRINGAWVEAKESVGPSRLTQ